MSEIILFHRKKQEVLQDALAAAEATVVKHYAQMDWLKRNGATLAEQVKASLVVEKAVHEFRRCEDTLVRFSGAARGHEQPSS